MNARLIITSALALAAAGLAIAGPLNPPSGPVTSTFKTLTEVEPRTAINGINTPASATGLYQITQPGSYYLTGNINLFQAKSAIEIAASDVTIDLNGYSISGIGTSIDGIRTVGLAHKRITIRNGSISYFGGYGINLTNGDNADGSLIENVTAAHNGNTGIYLAHDSSIRNCTASDNTGNGVFAGFNCRIQNCTAVRNGQTGLKCGQLCVISHCTCCFSQSAGIIADAATITDCVATGNQSGITANFSMVADCNIASNSLVGISVDGGSSVQRCVVVDNQGDGIRAGSKCLITGNACTDNGTVNPNAAGIRVDGANNRVSENTCTGNQRGISCTGAGSAFIHNTCGGNTTNYYIASGNMAYVVHALTNASLINGNSGGTSFGSTDPNANFSY